MLTPKNHNRTLRTGVFPGLVILNMQPDCQKGVFGSAVAWVHTIEFQKRGLPHMHLLMWLQREYKFITPVEVDAIISAGFPDPQTYPRLFRLISDVMAHVDSISLMHPACKTGAVINTILRNSVMRP